MTDALRANRPRLSRRQRRIVSLIACGARTTDIADALGISKWTARDHIHELGILFAVSSMIELPDAARDAGIILDPCVDEDEDDDGAIRVVEE